MIAIVTLRVRIPWVHSIVRANRVSMETEKPAAKVSKSLLLKNTK